MKKETKLRILLVEDNLNLGFLTTEFLESEGFDVKLCRDGESGVKAFTDGQFDFCILDIMLPKMDGYQVATLIRQLDPKVPIIFLTAKNLKGDKFKGFNLGADDYITKPFDEEELLWRINAVLNRTQKTVATIPNHIMIGRFCFEPHNQLLVLDNQGQRLTERETKILELLCQNLGNIIRREELLQQIWGENDYFAGRSLDVFIAKLRKYLKADTRVNIENVPRVGFLLSVNQ
ncbi:MAG: DNA-binding response regulator [Bacteroidetes bacterium HGW-Bacteroidetes-4]|jgi:DNA-binding response OmpR family regulator|nr:MAG: DNA-binding response regulator [Bacteroidetes bacterium HGW-Bacteroidetes-4]